jgi:hypothetical protein
MPGGGNSDSHRSHCLSVFPSPAARGTARPSGRGAELTAGGQLRNVNSIIT